MVTPGNWTNVNGIIKADSGEIIGLVWKDAEIPVEEQAANAQAMAASSKMLAAIEAVLSLEVEGRMQPRVTLYMPVLTMLRHVVTEARGERSKVLFTNE